MSKQALVVHIALIAFAAVALWVRSAAGAEAVPPSDPQRFFQVKEWRGAFETGAKSSGTREVPGNGVETYGSSVRVVARFTLAPHVDERNGPEPVWRGKGEAHVVVSGKSKTQYKEESITSTFTGDYVDTFSVEISNIDVEQGTYQMAVVRDLWQDQPHKGKAIHLRQVTVRRSGSYVHEEMRNGHSWADDGGAGFGRESPLPKEGLIIDGSMTNKNDDFLSEGGSKWVTTWQIRPGGTEFEEPLKAVAGGPYAVERGGTLNLDGLRSTGKIRSWKWTFAPADEKDTVPFNAGAAKDGRRVPAVLLAPVKATLTVSDGVTESSDTVVVNVTPRDYTTPFVHRETEKVHPASKKPFFKRNGETRIAAGENVCALDDYDHSVHILHPAAKSGTWKDAGYKVVQVKDAGGPFDGVWYLDDYALRIEREVLVNTYLLPGGPRLLSGIKNVYKANDKDKMESYLDAIRRHELLHTEFMRKALATNDPGPKVEPLAARDEAAIKEAADKAIQASEAAIDKASADPLPHLDYKEKIKFPDDATGEYIEVEVEI